MQAIALAIIVSVTLAYLRRKWRVSVIACAVVYAFFTLFLIVPLYAGAMMKDSLHLLALVHFFVMWAEVVRTRGGTA